MKRELKPSPLSTVLNQNSMAYLSIDRTGRFLLGASYGGNKVAIHPIGRVWLVARDGANE